MGKMLPHGPKAPDPATSAAPGVIRSTRSLLSVIFGLPLEDHHEATIVIMNGQAPCCITAVLEEPVFRLLVDEKGADYALATCHFAKEVASGNFVYREVRCRATGLSECPNFEWAARANTSDTKQRDLYHTVTSVILTGTET